MEYYENLSPTYPGPTIPGLRIAKDPINYDREHKSDWYSQVECQWRTEAQLMSPWLSVRNNNRNTEFVHQFSQINSPSELLPVRND